MNSFNILYIYLRKFAVRKLVNIRSLFKIISLDIKNMYSYSILGSMWFFLNPIIFFSCYYFFCVEIMGCQVQGMDTISTFFYISVGLSSFLLMSNMVLTACNGLIGSLDLFKNASYDPFWCLMKHIFLSIATYTPIIFTFIILKILIISNITVLNFFIFFYLFFLEIFFFISLVFLFSALSIFIRDFLSILQWAIYCIMFITPFGIRGETLFQKAPIFFYVNPLNYFVIPFQEILFFQKAPSLYYVFYLTLFVSLFFIFSKKFFFSVKEIITNHV